MEKIKGGDDTLKKVGKEDQNVIPKEAPNEVEKLTEKKPTNIF